MIGHSLVLGLMLLPQQPASEHPWTFSQTFSGSANESGVIVKSDSGLGYGLNRFFTIYGGVPFYFVHGSSTTTSSSTVSTAGLGNIYGGLRLSAGNAALGYSSNVTVAAPTGDEDRGREPRQAETGDGGRRRARRFETSIRGQYRDDRRRRDR